MIGAARRALLRLRFIKPFWFISETANHLTFARYALINRVLVSGRNRLEKRLLAVGVAVWAKPMRWLGASGVWLQHVSHAAIPQPLQFVILLFSVPCFEAANFCFERAYLIQLRRLRLASFDGLAERLQDSALEFYGFGSHRLSVAHTYHRLRNIQRRLRAGDGGGDLSDWHDDSPSFGNEGIKASRDEAGK